jgi:cyclopropane fatty-acyl-phospholipid synthase-like methyltransferase
VSLVGSSNDQSCFDAVDCREAIARYYDYTIGYYRVFWHGSTGAIHYGIRDERNRGRRAELLNTNRVMADQIGIVRNDRVLDAGCGVGGSAVWLARERGTRVVGITLSPGQVEKARRNARRNGLTDRIEFHLRDYTRTGFPEGSFDVVWALESSCYAANKAALAREARRLLRPGGKLVVADGFLRREPVNEVERGEYALFKRGLVLPDLVRPETLARALRDHGFGSVRVSDQTAGAWPSCVRLHRRCALAYPISSGLERLGITSPLLRANIRAGIAQLRMVRSGLAGYFVVSAQRQ